MEAFPNGGQHRRKSGSAKEAGCTAAEIDGVHHIVRGKGTGLADMGAKGLQVIIHHFLLRAGDGIKITVIAFAAAERNVDVDPQGGPFCLG